MQASNLLGVANYIHMLGRSATRLAFQTHYGTLRMPPRANKQSCEPCQC